MLMGCKPLLEHRKDILRENMEVNINIKEMIAEKLRLQASSIRHLDYV